MKLLRLAALAIVLTLSCTLAENGELAGDPLLLCDFNDDGQLDKWWSFNGDISITKTPRDVREGQGSLEWRYRVRKNTWNLLSLVKLDASRLKGQKGVSMWLKSDRPGPLVIQATERDGSNYQYFDINNPVDQQWRKFDITFESLKLDEDSRDENGRLDPGDIERIELVEVGGYFNTLSEGPRTLWVDDVRIIPRSASPPPKRTLEPWGRATPGVRFDDGKFGLGVLIADPRAMVVFPSAKALVSPQGTIEFFFRSAEPEHKEERVLLSCEDPPDLFGQEGNSVVMSVADGRLRFRANTNILTSPQLPLTAKIFHHVAVTWDSRGAVLYFDGQKVAENEAIRGLGRLAKDLVVGNDRRGGSPGRAVIDELRISDVKRSAEDVASSFRTTAELHADDSTVLLSHFNGGPLPEIGINGSGFIKGRKMTLSLTIPTPPDLSGNKSRSLHYDVVRGNAVVLRGENPLMLQADLSGRKNRVDLSVGPLTEGGAFTVRLTAFEGSSLLNRGERTLAVEPVESVGSPSPPLSPRRDGWFRKTNVYNIIPLPLEEAKRYGVTVNGVWGGILTADPILPAEEHSPAVRKLYRTEADFVTAMHAAGLKTSGVIVAVSGHETLIRRYPDLKQATSRTARGTGVTSHLMKESYTMSANNPAWNAWMAAQGKRAIDAGVDMIMIDEIQEFLFPFNFGFDPESMEGFRRHLRTVFTTTELRVHLGLADPDAPEMINRLAANSSLPYGERVRLDPLVEVFARFLEEQNYRTKKALIETLRDYAKSKRRSIALTGNVLSLDAVRLNGYWPKGLHFSHLLDFFAFEQVYSVAGQKKVEMPLPRGKWVAWEKLGEAATGSPAVPVIEAESLEKLSSRKIANYLYILFSEAYANRSAFMLYHIPTYKLDRQWKKCAEAAAFVLSNRSLYEDEQSVYSPAGILYLYGEGMRDKSSNYLGVAQALAESNVPFEVIFAGDGKYRDDAIPAGALRKYEVVLIPSALGITEHQKEAITRYVREGGHAVIFDPVEMRLYGDSREVKFGRGSFTVMAPVTVDGKAMDAGAAYNLAYDDSVRREIEETVNRHAGRAVTVHNSNRTVVVYPYLLAKDNRLILHVLNYDHDMASDEVRAKENIRITIREPRSYAPRKEATLLSPDFKTPMQVPVARKNGYLEVVVPRLFVYGVVAL